MPICSWTPCVIWLQHQCSRLKNSLLNDLNMNIVCFIGEEMTNSTVQLFRSSPGCTFGIKQCFVAQWAESRRFFISEWADYDLSYTLRILAGNLYPSNIYHLHKMAGF